MNIGARLKSARQARGLSLRALGEMTGFSASFLSQLELGRASPSLASLDRIASVFEMSLTDFLGEPKRVETPVLRRAEREALRSEWSKASAESLLPSGADDRLDAVLLSLEVGGRTGKMTLRPGVRQFAHCLKGRVRLLRGDERHALEPGDSVLVDGSAPAGWENGGEEPAEVLLVGARFGPEAVR